MLQDYILEGFVRNLFVQCDKLSASNFFFVHCTVHGLYRRRKFQTLLSFSLKSVEVRSTCTNQYRRVLAEMLLKRQIW